MAAPRRSDMSARIRNAVALRHVAFEDLGAFAPALTTAGFAVRYVDVGQSDLAALDANGPDLMIVLGGPIGAHNDATYPLLKHELEVIERRLADGRPTMGICLGAQRIARAAGARIYPNGIKEIGFGPITLTQAGAASCLAPFADDPVTLHWHGDTFDLPAGAIHLAATDLCQNQAFAVGGNIIGFQFHPEVEPRRIENWLIGHAVELAVSGVDIPDLRTAARAYAQGVERKAQTVITSWLDQVSW